MVILGIGFLSESSAAVVIDGDLVAAVSEERLNQLKGWYGFPEQAILTVLDMVGMRLEDVDVIATHGLTEPEPPVELYNNKRALIERADLSSSVRKRTLDFLERRFEHEKLVFGERTPSMLRTIKHLGRPVRVYHHHHAHAACAFYGSGFDRCSVLTADGWGEDGSASLWYCGTAAEPSKAMRRISTTPTLDSLGYFYGSITHTMGFKPHRHEGKVLGLAANCESPKSYRLLRSMIDVDLDRQQFVGNIERGLYLPNFENPELLQILEQYGREDVASGAQRALEDVVCQMVGSLKVEARKLAVAGGIFANVKLNQRLAELSNVEEFYVFPNMGDGGLSVGAAWLAHHDLVGAPPSPPRNMYLGPAPTKREIEDILSPSGLIYGSCMNINERAGKLLAKGKVIGRCAGPMEFGPRALGNRSILYQATDPSVNEWLNRHLKRSEFMPFAPATLVDAAAVRYVGLESTKMSPFFMTITLDCRSLMKEEAPAAVHVDGTARPQLVRESDNPDFFQILTKYMELTGRASIINTSFNMHEEPIVCTAADAVRAFLSIGLPYLVLGDFLVENPKSTFW